LRSENFRLGSPVQPGKEILVLYPADRMKAWPISARVNSPKNAAAEIIVPIELNTGRGWCLIHSFRHALMEENSNRSLTSGIFSRSDSKTQTQYLTKSTPPDEFNFQLNVALLVDFFQGVIKRPLFNVCPKFKRRVLNNLSGVILNVFQAQNLPQGSYTDSLLPNRQVLLCP
jgi:hypothetical protein